MIVHILVYDLFTYCGIFDGYQSYSLQFLEQYMTVLQNGHGTD